MCFTPTLIIRCTVYEIQPVESSVSFIWPLHAILGQMSLCKLNDYMTSYTCKCFTQKTLIIACTVSEIYAQIDHKGSNWTFLTLKMTFRVIPCLSYFMTGLVSYYGNYVMQYNWAALRYYWIILIIMGKWTIPDLSDLENDLLNNSIKSSLDSWSI